MTKYQSEDLTRSIEFLADVSTPVESPKKENARLFFTPSYERAPITLDSYPLPCEYCDKPIHVFQTHIIAERTDTKRKFAAHEACAERNVIPAPVLIFFC